MGVRYPSKACLHYGSVAGKPSDAQTFASLIKTPVKVVEKIKF